MMLSQKVVGGLALVNTCSIETLPHFMLVNCCVVLNFAIILFPACFYFDFP